MELRRKKQQSLHVSEPRQRHFGFFSPPASLLCNLTSILPFDLPWTWQECPHQNSSRHYQSPSFEMYIICLPKNRLEILIPRKAESRKGA